MLALRELDPDELERDLLLDQDESGAASSTGRVGAVESDNHDQDGEGTEGVLRIPNVMSAILLNQSAAYSSVDKNPEGNCATSGAFGVASVMIG